MKILIVDVETGGLNERESPLLEIGVSDLETGRALSVGVRVPFAGLALFLSRWWPWMAKRFGLWLDPRAMAINERDPRAGATSNEAIEEVMRFLTATSDGFGMRSSDVFLILAGMNPNFDLRFLRAAWKKSPFQFPFAHRTLDMHSLALARLVSERGAVTESVFGLKTDAIYEMLEMEPEPKPHSAINGVRMERLAFLKLLGLNEPPLSVQRTDTVDSCGTTSPSVESAAEALGFVACDFGGTCEKCESEWGKLYYGNTNYWDSREGDYWCGECVREMHIQNGRDSEQITSS
jgi:DNA polymerase III epsilon subunit-like protein